jgi:cell division ATPase FtsA
MLEFQENSGVLIVDAGGGTIDITAYRRLADKSFEEIAIPTCTSRLAFMVLRVSLTSRPSN